MDDEAENNKLYTSNRRSFLSMGAYRKAIEKHEKDLKIAIEKSDRGGEGGAYGNLGNAHQSLGDYRKAIEYHEKHLKIAMEMAQRGGEGRAYGNLGNTYLLMGYYRKAIKYHKEVLKITIEIGDRGGEGAAYGGLGSAYRSLGNNQKSIEYHEKHLKIAMEIGNRDGEGAAYGNLGNAYHSLGDYRKAIEYHEKSLKIAMEIGNRGGEGATYGNIGSAYHSLGDYRKAIEYGEKHLKITIEIGDQGGEGTAYGNLGNVYRSLGDYRKAIEYTEKHLEIAMEIGDRDGEGRAYGNLGSAYGLQGDYGKAIAYLEKELESAIEIGDRESKRRAYGNLGIAYRSLGDYRKAIDYSEKGLEIAIEIGDRGGEGAAYVNLGNTYRLMGDYRKAIEYHEKCLKIAIEIGHRGREGGAYGNLSSAYNSLGDYRKAIEYIEKQLEIAIEIGDRCGEGKAYGNLGNTYGLLGAYRKAIEYNEKCLKIAIEIGDRRGELRAYHNIGAVYVLLKQFENAVGNFVCSVKALNTLRSCLKCKDDWKINFRNLHDNTYAALWMSLLKLGKINEALLAAEQGRAQTLSDNLLNQYKLPASSAATIDTKETISRLFTELSITTIFLAIKDLRINIWFLSRKKQVVFRIGRLEGDRTEEDPIRALLQSSLEKIGSEDAVRCEDRTFNELENECSFRMQVRGKGVGKLPLPSLDNPFKPFYDAVIDPIVDLLGSQDGKLVIVPDGALCFIPWAAVTESIRIRIVPSLTSYQLILSVPEGHHRKTGALLVGNPCLNQLKKPQPDLPCAQREVEMIATILNTTPLTERQATKAEVMKRMSSVGLIHIAAHGNRHTGEIALSPNPGWTSKFPQKKDFILTMSDVQAADLRARLVVLSCCHSGRGRISKGEGVVGIARAFLAAGARSVLVTLWAIDDEATMVFMKSFYQHLKEGKTASSAVQQSMKSLRESDLYSEMRYWAPFQLIGDDVRIEFEGDDDAKQ